MVKSALENIKNQQDMLRVLANCKSKLRKAILNNADKELVDAICQCVFNILQGNVKLNTKETHKLKSYRTALRKLVDKSSLKTKKKILVQKGGFLQFLIPAAITGISSIISSLISAKASTPQQ